MRYKFHTLSAAFYVIDTDEMTWERHTPDPKTLKKVIGLEETRGVLADVPILRIGRSCIIPIWETEDGIKFANTIRTTPVQRIELLDADPD